jgi:hypothetical protein
MVLERARRVGSGAVLGAQISSQLTQSFASCLRIAAHVGSAGRDACRYGALRLLTLC